MSLETEKIIAVPRINDSVFDFGRLAEIQESVKQAKKNIVFTFNNCDFLRPNAVAFLGGVAREHQLSGYKVTFDWNSIKADVMANLCQNGFAGYFNYETQKWDGNSIPYYEVYANESLTHNVYLYLKDKWLGKTKTPNEQVNEIVSSVLEVYMNALEHGTSSSKIVFTCGQYFPNIKELILAVVDFGEGFATPIRRFCKVQGWETAEKLNDASCIRLALREGFSSCGQGRGLGLNLLADFVLANEGTLEIYSSSGRAIINKYSLPNQPSSFKTMQFTIDGTIVYIRLKCIAG